MGAVNFYEESLLTKESFQLTITSLCSSQRMFANKKTSHGYISVYTFSF